MRSHRSNSTEQNFWVSYADLMAGLLFVFILVLGAIVVKYVFIQDDLSGIKTDLTQQQQLLTLKEEELLEKNRNILSISNELTQKTRQNQSLLLELEEIKKALIESENAQNALALNLEESNQTLSTQTIRIQELTQTIEVQNSKHLALLSDLSMTQARIKNLTGIRLKVIQELKAKLGNRINIDPNSGAIRLPSSILFDVGSYEIKPEAQKRLKEALEPYFDVLLSEPSMRENIDKIIIEGHTDSDGTYMNNLELSQKRALSVMAFIYTWNEKKNPLLQQYLSAQGRSFSDRILKNGTEDKEASRRIEIKFSLSNKQAIEEIESFLKR